MWNTLTGEELLTLEGHKNVVYAIAFNNPFGDKIVTGDPHPNPSPSANANRVTLTLTLTLALTLALTLTLTRLVR